MPPELPSGAAGPPFGAAHGWAGSAPNFSLSDEHHMSAIIPPRIVNDSKVSPNPKPLRKVGEPKHVSIISKVSAHEKSILPQRRHSHTPISATNSANPSAESKMPDICIGVRL